LAENTVNGSGNRARSGAQTLALLADPLNALVIRSLSTEPKRQVELRRETGSPAQSTLRARLKNLEEIGAIAGKRRDAFPGTVEYELEKAGEELLFVAVTLDRWLAAAPHGPLALGTDAAKAAIRALVDGWSSTMLRVLAAGPLSLTELDRLIGSLNYPSLERRLGAMRLAGLVEPVPGNAKGTPYAVTEWLRFGTAPLAAAIRWERHNAPERAAPLGRLDVEAGLLLAVPLVRLANELSGSCRIAVDLSSGHGRSVGLTATFLDGRVASCIAAAGGELDAWISGSPAAWLRAAIEADPSQLELGGDCRLARGLVEGLRISLFGAGQGEAPASSVTR
jgi:DNA-binding HxlR family transcriptional regulator